MLSVMDSKRDAVRVQGELYVPVEVCVRAAQGAGGLWPTYPTLQTDRPMPALEPMPSLTASWS